MSPFFQKIVIVAESNAITFFFLRFLRRIKSVYRILFSSGSILKNSGWLKSSATLRPVDAQNQPIPWISYSAIHFLAERVSADMNILEYGSGNSTLWWSNRVLKVTSVEHDPIWHEKVSKGLPQNVNYIFRPLDDTDSYECSAQHTNELYDIIVVDGRRRVECIKQSISCLTPNGVIILDNSDRPRYSEGIELLIKSGFRKIEFKGLIAIGIHPVETTIFYKDENVLSI